MAAATHTKEMLGLIDSIDLDKGDYKRLRKAFTTVQDKVGVLGQSLEQEILLTGNAMRGAANEYNEAFEVYAQLQADRRELYRVETGLVADRERVVDIQVRMQRVVDTATAKINDWELTAGSIASASVIVSELMTIARNLDHDLDQVRAEQRETGRRVKAQLQVVRDKKAVCEPFEQKIKHLMKLMDDRATFLLKKTDQWTKEVTEMSGITLYPPANQGEASH